MAFESPTEWGPRFWEQGYGFTSFEQFAEKAGPLVEGFGLGFIKLPTELLLRNCWYQPGSGVGTYVAGRLLADPQGLQVVSTAPWRSAADQAYTVTQENSMATLIIPNAFQVAIEGLAGGEPIVNVIGVTNAAGTAAGAAAAVKAAWETGTGSPIAQLSSLYSVVNYRAVDLSSVFGDIADLSSTTTGGVATAPFATLASAALIQWNGATRSRSTRGRLYFGPQREAVINSDGRTLTSAAVTAFTTAFTNFRTSLASAGYPLAVLSRKNQEAYPVTSATCETVLATQRRRIR